MKLNEKFKAIELRQRGYSYPKIAALIKVSKSTLSRWLQEIELTSHQKEKLENNSKRALYSYSRYRREKRFKETKEIINDAKKKFPSLLKNLLFISGLLLYWAEGDKNRQERVKFTNSDERMIALMMRWFREICSVPENKFRIALHIHNLHIRHNVIDYWSKLTKISDKQFHKPYIKKTTLKQRRNILYNGTCAIVINNKSLFRKIEGWKLGMLEYFNIRL